MDLKTVLTFLGGVAVGSAATFFIMKNRKETEEEDISEEEYQAAEHIREIAEERQPKTINTETKETKPLYFNPDTFDKIKNWVAKNEQMKEEMFKKYFASEEHEEGDDLAETTVTTTGEIIKAAEVISPIQFFEDELDDDGEEIVKAEDPLIYFEGDGVLINTEDTEPYEPVSEETCEEYLNLDEVIKHFGEGGEDGVVYVRCYEKPVTDYKIVQEHIAFRNSQWYSGEDE